MEKEKNICWSCKFCLWPSGKCNRLVFTAIGMNDRIGSDYKKNNVCPYHEKGQPQKREYKPMNFFNS